MEPEEFLEDFIEEMEEEARTAGDRDTATDIFIEEAGYTVQRLETEEKVKLARELRVHDEVMTDKSQQTVAEVLNMKLVRELATTARRKVWDQ